MEIKLRSRIFPSEVWNVGAFLFICSVIPLVYWFELYVVLPTLYEVGSFHFWVHFFVGNFLALNVVGSYMGLLLIDNSVKRHVTSQDVRPDWRHCDKCNIEVPPRSWHCTVCDACMLKRDHHCFFTGYCIGHHNHRLFMLFLLYTLISCIYATFYNCFFLTRTMKFSTWLLRSIFSVPLLLTQKEMDITLFYLLIVHIIIGGAILVLVLLVYHSYLIAYGWVGHEQKYNISKYNRGTKQNLINVFGRRWYLSWLSPFISSQLPSNGFIWEHESKSS